MNAWEKMNITQNIVDCCGNLSETSYTEKSREYYAKCHGFLQSIESVLYDQLSLKQRTWIRSIKNDLRKEGLI